MIYITGDTHCDIDIKKLNTKNFPVQKSLTKNDYVIVLGDFGLLWHKDKTYEYYKAWYDSKSFTTLWIDGNHENHEWIDSLPVSEWNGGKVHMVSDSIIHLMRGQVFQLEGKKIFTCGGATSVDKESRQAGVSWWARENLSFREEQEALANLEAHDYQVDYIFTHTCPDSIIIPMFHVPPGNDPTSRFLDEVLRLTRCRFTRWAFGHWHVDQNWGKFSCLYDSIVSLDYLDICLSN